MCIQRTAVIAQVGIYHSEVALYYQILVVIGCGMLADIQVAIETVEFVRLIDVIVMTQHRHS